MQSNEFIEFNCIELTQPVGKFYIGSINSKDLAFISYADVRRILRDRDVEKYLGIQRPLSESRVAELKEYVGTVDATFPTSIIIAVSSKDADFDEDKKIMKIRKSKKVAKIIDGQHRIAGLESYSKDNFQLNITIFIDMDIEDQAMVFATINLKQTKVSKSLAYDLYEFSKSRSPQKTCHNIAKFLNNKDGSPFKDKIKILGLATGRPQESLTQAAFVDRLIEYISLEPMKDRDLIKRGGTLRKATGDLGRKLIFRNMFINDKDAKIAKNIWNYFKAVENKWAQSWRVTRVGNILNRTTGFSALMKFMRDVYLHFGVLDDVLSTDKYYSILETINLSDDNFTPENYKPGSSGASSLYKEFIDLSEIKPA